ncbi:MAG: PilZ domain-containing protein [Thermodesulfobacteriota bacterium]
MAAAERRERKRVPVKFRVDCIHEEDYLISFSKDISADGMFIHTENPPEVGRQIELHFSIDGVEKLEVPARVVWVNRAGSKKDFGLGVKFIRPRVMVKDSIMRAVNKVAILEKPA